MCVTVDWDTVSLPLQPSCIFLVAWIRRNVIWLKSGGQLQEQQRLLFHTSEVHCINGNRNRNDGQLSACTPKELTSLWNLVFPLETHYYAFKILFSHSEFSAFALEKCISQSALQILVIFQIFKAQRTTTLECKKKNCLGSLRQLEASLNY